MSRRQHILLPGRFVKTTLLSKTFIVDDPACCFCRTATCGPFFVEITQEGICGHVVCRTCMGDPWENGEQVAKRLVSLILQEDAR